jgi:hypothetical protein
VATARRDDVPLASARSGQRERVFMIERIDRSRSLECAITMP